MKFQKIPFGQLSIEFLSVVFAVLLALGLNSYKQSLDTTAEARQLKRAILTECKNNLAKIDSVLIQNQWYVDYLDSIVQLPTAEQKGKFQFSYEIELLARGAWDVAQNNQASSSLDQDFLHEVSDLYNLQDFYMDFSKDMISQMGTTLSSYRKLEEVDLILSMHYKISVINTFALELQQTYRKLLQTYPPIE